MKFEDSPVAYFNNGKKVGDDFNLPFGGSWTKKKKIYLNENMDEPMKAFNIKEDKDTFTSRIIAHELAHELYNNHASDLLKQEIAKNIKDKKFTTPYLKTVNKDKLEEEAFAEYVADSLL
jgi:predicted SprT family Zn-dependent metalloprotease